MTIQHTDFSLHPRLQHDCYAMGRLSLCRLLLMNDANYPWCILVPERADISEVFHLSTEDQIILQQETALLGQSLQRLFQADKINIGAIGNMVPQLHIHVIARFKNDPVWPAPVWGKMEAKKYTEIALKNAILSIQNALGDKLTAIS